MARPTIRDVAEKAGYSVAAVSLTLNNREARISKETREKIRAVAKEMNYRQNRLAVDMLRKRTMVFGLIIPDNSNLFFAELSRSIESAASLSRYNLIYGNSDNNPRKDYEYMSVFADRQVDGIIFARSAGMSAEESGRLFRLIDQIEIPVVFVDRELPAGGSRRGCVLLDHEQGGFLAGRHLTGLGHRKIGCFTGPAELESSQKRLLGFRRAMERAGAAHGDDLVFEGDYRIGQGREALEFFRAREVSAIFAFNDLMAIDLYRSANQAGLRIPDDISLVGFDNIPFAELVSPALTTVHQPVREMGRSVVDTMLDIIEGAGEEAPGRRKIFEPRLIVRESTCAVAAEKN